MSWKHGIQTSKRTDSLIGLTGLFGLLALGTCLAANSPVQPAATAGDGQENSFSSAEEFAHKNFLKMGYSCGSAKYHDDKKCGYSLTQPAAATAPAAPTPAAAITVGKPDRLPVKPALSRDEQIADGIATFIAYDHSCVTMPAAATRMAHQALETIPLDTFKAATQRVAEFHNSMGPGKWCAAMKPIAERAMGARR